MTTDFNHESGCDKRHPNSQACNGPVADARRAERNRAIALARAQHGNGNESWISWRPAARFGAAFEAIPGIAVAIVWIGSLPESHQYHDFGYLHLIALLPAIGWFWRGAVGCGIAPTVWFARLILLAVAASMWGRANDHVSIFVFSDHPPADVHCCRPAYQAAMHLAMASLVALSALSAYGVGWWRREQRN